MYEMPNVVVAHVWKPARGSARVNDTSASRSIAATSVAATSPGGSSAVSRVVTTPPTPPSFALTSPAAVSAMPATMASTCGGSYPAASSSATTSTRARNATMPMRSDSHGSPRKTIARISGARRRAVMRRVRSIGQPPNRRSRRS